MSISYGKICEIFKLFGRNLSERSIYNNTRRFMYLTELATAHMIQDFVNNGSDFTLHFDETTMGIHKIQGFILTCVVQYEIKEVVVAIEKVPTKSSDYQMYVLLNALDRMDYILKAKGEFKTKFLLALNSCMADGAATSTAFNHLLNEERRKLGPHLSLNMLSLQQCCIHIANNISKETIKYLEKEYQLFCPHIKELAKVLNFKNAAYHPIASDFFNFQKTKSSFQPKSLKDEAGHRFMYINEIAVQILNLRSLILEYLETCSATYKECDLIKQYLLDERFIYYLNLCVTIHSIFIEPVHKMSSSDLLLQSYHVEFKTVLENLFEYVESGQVTSDGIKSLIPETYHFAFKFTNIALIDSLDKTDNFFNLLSAVKSIVTKRYFCLPMDDVYSFFNNINVERIFAMCKRNTDIAPHKEIYMRTQQIKARFNKAMFYIEENNILDQTPLVELNTHSRWIKTNFNNMLQWNFTERIKRLERLQQACLAKRKKRDSKSFLEKILNAEIMDIISLEEALCQIELKTDREIFLRRQLKMLRESGLKFGQNRPWLDKPVSNEEKLLLKIKSLHGEPS